MATEEDLNLRSATEMLKACKLTGSNWGSEDGFMSVLSSTGPAGIRVLTDELSSRSDQYERERLVRALVSCSDRAAIEPLRSVARTAGPGTEDSRWMSLNGLAAILGSDATPDLEAALQGRSSVIRWCSLIALAKIGTDEAWGTAFSLFQKMLKRPAPKRGTMPPVNVVAVCYLGRFVDGLDRRRQLVTLLRERWEKLPAEDQQVLRLVWPGVDPSGPDPEVLDPPDPEQLLVGTEDASYTLGPLRVRRV